MNEGAQVAQFGTCDVLDTLYDGAFRPLSVSAAPQSGAKCLLM
jgi:hypothetical protein